MTAKEQGDSIIERYKELCPDNYIECALAAVSELIAEHTWQSPISWNTSRKKYWLFVKEYIATLTTKQS
jgi:hypothetical protein